MAIVLGMNGHLAYNTNGAGGGGTWTTINNVGDVNLSAESSTTDVPTRLRAPWHQHIALWKDVTIECDVPWDTAATDLWLNIARTYMLIRSAIGARCYDGAAGQGIIGDFNVTSIERVEALDGAMMAKVTLKLAKSATIALWNGA